MPRPGRHRSWRTRPGGDGATFTIQGFPAGSFYQWRLTALNLTSTSKKQVDLLDGSGNVLYQSPLGQKMCGPCTAWTTSSNSLGTVQLTRHQGMQPGDSFQLDLIVTTPTPNSQTTEYRIRGIYGSAPTVEAM